MFWNSKESFLFNVYFPIAYSYIPRQREFSPKIFLNVDFDSTSIFFILHSDLHICDSVYDLDLFRRISTLHSITKLL